MWIEVSLKFLISGMCPQISSGTLVDRLVVTYQKADGTRVDIQHGGDGGSQQASFNLASDEWINEIGGRGGQYIDQLYFKTNTGRQYGPYGGNGGGAFCAVIDGQACGFSGGDGGWLDQICMHYISN